MPRPSGTRQRPARARSSARAPLTRRPASTTSPPVAGCRPAMTVSSVVLPGAVGPEDGDDRARPARRGRCRAAPRWGRSRRGGRGAEQRARVTRAAPEVGGEHRRVALHLGRRAAGEQRPEVEHVDVRAHLHHQLDVVLDEHHRDALGRELAQQRSRTRPSRARPARWPARRAGAPSASVAQRPGQLDQAGLAGGQPVGPLVGQLARCRAARAARRRPRRDRRRPATSAASRTFSRTVSRPKGSRRWNVRARPRRARLNGASSVTSRPSSATRRRRGGWSPQIDVEQRRLAGAVRADEAGDRPGLGGEVDVVEGEAAAEADADTGDLERRAVTRAPPRASRPRRGVELADLVVA